MDSSQGERRSFSGARVPSMTRAAGTSARFRQRKLSTKQTLQIVREDQVEKVDDDQPRNIPKVDSGVEKAEEIVSSLSYSLLIFEAPTGDWSRDYRAPR